MTTRDDPVVVAGMGCRLPGGINSPEALWATILEGRDAVGPMPPGRFDIERFFHPEPRTPGKMVAAEGGFLEDVDCFDAAFFGISAREARKMDPQQRILLEVVWEALEDAGIVPSSLAGSRTGVYVGLWSGEYENVIYRTPADLDFHSLTGGGRYAASGRVSWAFDFRGPCVTVDSGCSASLSALHMARRAILDGEIDVAVVGAANLILQPHVSIGYSRSGMLSPGARCRFGDAEAVGYVRSEGVAAAVLERMSRARTKGDPVRGVILDSAVNADGRGSGQLATPSAEAQAELLETVWSRSTFAPHRVPYVEAHGTGTRVGDPVELEALGSVLGRERPRHTPLMVGSVKTNIGHTEACAGMAGLFKTILALEHGVIPPNLHLRKPNPEVAWDDLRVTVPTTATSWPSDAPRIAGVSSFGITGTNAHAILAAREEIEPSDDQPAPTGAGPGVVSISAVSEEALLARVRDLREVLTGDDPPEFADLVYTTTCRREHLSHRIAIVADSNATVVDGLKEFLDTGAAPRLARGVVNPSSPPRVAFVFSGQGSQWEGMGRELLASSPVFAEAIESCDRALPSTADFSILSILEGRGPELDAVEVIQPTLVAVQIALALHLESLGVAPDAVVGHSMGEVAAAHIAGALSLEDAIRVVATRSRLLAGIAGHGGMGLVDLGRDTIAERLEPYEGRLSVAALNGPRSTVLSGDPEALDELLAELDDEDIFCRRIRVDVASHSPQCDPLVPLLMDELAELSPTPPNIPFHSTPLAAATGPAPLDGAYWARHNLRGAVRLDETIRGMIAEGIDTFVEISPHPILLSSLADIASDAEVSANVVGLLRREEPEGERVLDTLSRLHVAGVPVDWSQHADSAARPNRLPAYPWQRKRHWLDNWEDWSGNAAEPARTSWPREADGWLHGIEWEEVTLAGSTDRGGASRWVLIAGPSKIADFLEALLPSVVRVTPADDVALADALGQTPSGPDGVIVLGLPGASDGEGDARHDEAIAHCDVVRRVVQHLAERDSAVSRLILATCGARQNGSSSRIDPAGAALWGFGRALREEQPELGVRLVDLDPDTSDQDAAAALAFAMSDATRTDDVVSRESRWYTPRLVRREPPQAERRAWPLRGATLVTGGLGDLGLAIARRLLELDAGPLVLLSRTPLPPRSEWGSLDSQTKVGERVEALRELEAMGGAVEVRSVDVGDARALETFVDAWRAEARPDFVAVVHAAGTLDSHLVHDLSQEALHKVFLGKVAGAFNLDRIFPTAERFVLFSSTSAMMPQPGEANYSAANAALDGLAEDRKSRGLEAQSINWGVWNDSGLIADARGARYVEELARQGVGTMPPDTAVSVFERIACSNLARAFVAPIDWGRYSEGRRGGRLDPLFRTMGGAGSSERSSVREMLAGLPEAEREDTMRDVVRSILGNVLGVGATDVQAGVTFGAQGMDSLMAMEFRNELEGRLSIAVSATIAWNYPTVDLLATYLLRRLGETGHGAIEAEPVGSAPGQAIHRSSAGTGVRSEPAEDGSDQGELARQAREVAGLSDDEALRELLGDQ